MTAFELLKAIGYAQDSYIQDAGEIPTKTRRPPSRLLVRTIAAVMAALLALGLFLQTPTGAAAAEAVMEQVTRLLDLLFPPKEEIVYVEGVPETIHVEARGQEPEETEPGFSLYVDTESYAMTEEAGAWSVRPILANPDLPPVEMVIREYPDKSPLAAAEEMAEQMAGQWETQQPIVPWETQTGAFCFSASQGLQWDSVLEDHYFLDNLQGGCYHIRICCFLEAYEGHGVRLQQMLRSFTIVSPQNFPPAGE